MQGCMSLWGMHGDLQYLQDVAGCHLEALTELIASCLNLRAADLVASEWLSHLLIWLSIIHRIQLPHRSRCVISTSQLQKIRIISLVDIFARQDRSSIQWNTPREISKHLPRIYTYGTSSNIHKKINYCLSTYGDNNIFSFCVLVQNSWDGICSHPSSQVIKQNKTKVALNWDLKSFLNHNNTLWECGCS